MMAGTEIKPTGEIDRDFVAMMEAHHPGANSRWHQRQHAHLALHHPAQSRGQPTAGVRAPHVEIKEIMHPLADEARRQISGTI
jgi:hypothetical protein